MLKLAKNNLKFTINPCWNSVRQITLSGALNLKRIEKTEDKNTNTITIEGKYLDPNKEFRAKVLNLTGENHEDSNPVLKPCAFCELEKRDIKVQYTDVLVIRQFLTENGQVLPRKVTGLCKKQQRKLIVMTKQAKHAGLILNLQPALLDETRPSIDHTSRTKHLRWNTYFDDYETMKRTKKFL